MKNVTLHLSVLVAMLAPFAPPVAGFAQSFASSNDMPAVAASYSASPEPAIFASGGASFGGSSLNVAPAVNSGGFRPLSHVAVGAGISPLGIGLVTAVNLSQHLDLRATGNFFNYSTTFNTNGFNVDAKLNMASAGASVDYYPFHWGLRLSPGILFYNKNGASANAPVAPGSSFTLNDQTFYAATPNAALGRTALTGTGTVGLNATKPAFTMTTGIGNLIPRSGRHWSIPFEIGAAFTGSPTVNMSLTGWACYDQAQTECTNVADPTNPIAVLIQGDLQSQVTKWRNDIEPLKVYPIVSTGIVFNFGVRHSL
ncbi:hypothetical protein [Acidicapsa acidisoli]|uniref:hypothetical protein n=1 Tax=Acidicapsa acidisoli TaxID=1615681 RepID=UPI0021E0B245|nr:hypothetical protein [Acidicapsa acidisoli]